MTVKFTMFFQLATNTLSPNLLQRRLGGWSESHYFPGTDTSAALAAAQLGVGAGASLLGTRANLLPGGASIVGMRLQNLGPPVGQILIAPGGYVGNNVFGADIPQQALLVRMPGLGVTNVRRLILRGIPDFNVKDGEFNPDPGYGLSVIQFLGVLGSWAFRGRDLAQLAFKIIQIDATGSVTTELAHPYAINDMVRVLKTKLAPRGLVGGRFQVATIGPLVNQFKLLNWTRGLTTGGSVRKDAVIFPLMNAAAAVVTKCIVRKVGRPFGQYRGRRSAISR